MLIFWIILGIVASFFSWLMVIDCNKHLKRVRIGIPYNKDGVFGYGEARGAWFLIALIVTLNVVIDIVKLLFF
ncbi:hypothetical protein AYK24_00045 [Thermoplasmatales archaeon SG8-52-4]|nr:MAG: hypothetical protein AYK24_00045 [Thermoplasmatales archaeon SG8-52-4]